MARTRRVGKWTITIESGETDDTVGIERRAREATSWTAQVDGRVTVLASSPWGLYVGTSNGVVSRLETDTGRRCAMCTLAAPIDAIVVDGTLATITTRDGDTVVLARSLRAPKR